MLASWARRVPCAPHDHGGSAGVVVIVAGRFEERRYTFDGERLTRSAWVVREEGSAIVVPATLIHDMESLEARGATLHLYAPRPEPMRLYDQERRETVIAGEGEGAWLPVRAPLGRALWTGR
jgi:hypothetical protein